MLDGVLAEAAPGKIGRYGGPAPAPVDDCGRPVTFRLQCGERRLHDLGRDSLPLQIPPDRLVAVSPPGKRRCAVDGEPVVVDEPGALERAERITPLRLVDAGAAQPGVESARRVVTPPQRPHG